MVVKAHPPARASKWQAGYQSTQNMLTLSAVVEVERALMTSPLYAMRGSHQPPRLTLFH